MKIIVLGGGSSPERDVSLRSAASVSKALRVAGFEVIEADPRDGFAVLDNADADTVVFPILHGHGGEDGSIQAELERRNLRFLGTDSQHSALCFNKWQTRQLLLEAKLPVAQGGKVTRDTYSTHELASKPHVLKVCRGGSSIGTYIVHDPKAVDDDEVSKVFKLDNEAVIEELVVGVEITVPVFGKKALPVIEIRPPEGGEFDYANKYNGKTAELCPAISISSDLQKRAQLVAEQVHAALGARHLSRTDIIVRPDGSMIVLELNTMPGMTDQSLYPKAAQVAGMAMPQLVTEFAAMVNDNQRQET